MLTETAIAICTPLQKRTRLHTSGIRMPRGKKSITLPFALCMQNARALVPSGRFAEKQLSVARLGRRSTPAIASALALELWLVLSVATAKPQRYTTTINSRPSRCNDHGYREVRWRTAERPTNRVRRENSGPKTERHNCDTEGTDRICGAPYRKISGCDQLHVQIVGIRDNSAN